MPSSTRKRIAQEHAVLQRDPVDMCSISPVDDSDLHHWIGTITGLPDTPYAGQVISICIDFPEDYPLKPFKLTFTTAIFHPNISTEGEVRLGELEEDQWSPVQTAGKILLSLQVLLSEPNLADGCILNEEAAAVYLEDREKFEDKARERAGFHAATS